MKIPKIINPKKLFVKKKAEYESQKGMNKNISKPESKIIIKRLMGDVAITVATFKAIQDKDKDFNLVLTSSENADFKEDISIVKNKIIDMLIYKLDLSGKTKAEKLTTIDAEITAQEKIIKDVKNGISPEETPKKSNVIDEDYRLCTLKSLKFSVQNHDGKGSYEEINDEGYKQMTFLSLDGILYPYWLGSTNVTMHPDIASKRKIHKERQDMIEMDYLDENKGALGGWWMNIVKFIILALLVLNMWWSFDLHASRQEFTDFMDSSSYKELLELSEGSAIRCGSYLNFQIETNKEFIDYAKQSLLNKTEKNINSENKIQLE